MKLRIIFFEIQYIIWTNHKEKKISNQDYKKIYTLNIWVNLVNIKLFKEKLMKNL